MNLLMLAPEIQEELLFLPRLEQGRDEMCLKDFQAVAAIVVWREQATAFSRSSGRDPNSLCGFGSVPFVPMGSMLASPSLKTGQCFSQRTCS